MPRPMFNARLSPPGLISQNQQEQAESLAQTTNDSDRTIALEQAPAGMEYRVMLADRVNDVFTPNGVSYSNQDPQKGGAPGSPGGAPGGNDPWSGTNYITSESPTAVTTPGGAPVSQLKLSFGASDWTSPQPTALPAHLKIGIRQNPNAAQTSIGLWSSEGPMANTKYTSPAPWAAGAYIG